MTYTLGEKSEVRDLAEVILHDELGWDSYSAENKSHSTISKELGYFDNDSVILKDILFKALKKINDWMKPADMEKVYDVIIHKTHNESLMEINCRRHDMLINGVKIETDSLGNKETRLVYLIDFNDKQNNSYLAVKELKIFGPFLNGIPDMLGFVNGLPLVFFEFKHVNMDVENAYNDNLMQYEANIPQLFYFNEIIILSNIDDTKIGSLGSPFKFYSTWNRIVDKADILENGAPEVDEEETNLGMALRLLLNHETLLDVLENFILYDDKGVKSKILCRNHQYLAVNRALDRYKDRKRLNGGLGVFWHTQGSGKSYTMVFLARKILRKFSNPPLFIMVTDREDLNIQLCNNFSTCGMLKGFKTDEFIAQSKKDLIDKIKGGRSFVFTLIQKFNDENFKPLDLNREVVLFFDEAHRSQYGTYARCLRKLLPDSSKFGFTGTPILDNNEITKITFGFDGKYASIYDYGMAIEDKNTVKLLFAERSHLIGLENEKITEEIRNEVDKFDYNTDEERAKIEEALADKDFVLCSEKRINVLANDFVEHYLKNRHLGKAMVVSTIRLASVRMYLRVRELWDKIIEENENKLKATNDEDEKSELKELIDWMKETVMDVVISQSQDEIVYFSKRGIDIKKIRQNQKGRNLDEEFKEKKSPFRVVFVCAMWLTGFDVPSLALMYLDKPIKAHSLMQTIARANRLCDGKSYGLIVDYIGLAEQLKEALKQYSNGGNTTGGGNGGNGGSGTGGGGYVIDLQKLLKDTSDLIDGLETKINNLALEYHIDFELIKLISITKKEQKHIYASRGAQVILRTDGFKKEFYTIFNQLERNMTMLLSHNMDVNAIGSKFRALQMLYHRIQDQMKHVDISDLLVKIDQIVDRSITVNNKVEDFDPIDISDINFDKIENAFKQSTNKVFCVEALRLRIERYLKKLVEDNPNPERLNYYERYNRIIKEYNESHDRDAVERAFNELKNLTSDMSVEDKRYISEGFDNEKQLAVFDLLNNKKLKPAQVQLLKDMSKKLIDLVVAKTKSLLRWREYRNKMDQVRSTISNELYTLPEEDFDDATIEEYTDKVFKFFVNDRNIA